MKKICCYAGCKKEYNTERIDQKYCSVPCRQKQLGLNYSLGINLKWKKRICELCKKEYNPKAHNQRYCSKKCADKVNSFEYQAKYGGKTQYYKLRFEILKRDNFTCQYCGRNVKEDKVKLHVDHIKPKKLKGKFLADNLITSCEECNEGKKDILLEDKKLKCLCGSVLGLIIVNIC